MTGAGLAPLPVQRPIPIWFGAASPRPTSVPAGSPTAGSPWCRRAPTSTKPRPWSAAAASQAGRDPAAIGMEGQASWGSSGLEAVVEQAGLWSSAGATHLSINTMGAGFRSVDEHLAALAKTAEGLGITAGTT